MKQNTGNNGTGILFMVSGVISIVFIIVWILMLSGDDPARAWRGLLVNYLFFTSASAGLLVWPAIIVVSEGEWMGPLEKLSHVGLAFSLPSIVALIALWAGSGNWAPWVNIETHKFWLNNNFLFSRNLVLLILFWISGFYFIRNRYGRNNRSAAIALILIYVITFSIAGFDFVMSLDPQWHSMMMGGYVFSTGLYTASAAWAFISVISGRPEKRSLTDICELTVSFALLSAYLMFSQLLPIWYENLPDETTYLIPMINLAWKKISYLVLFLVYLGPVLLLMTKWSKTNYIYVGVVNLLLMAGLWIEKWWLVSSVFERHQILFGWAEIIPALACITIIISALPLALNYSAGKYSAPI